MGGGGKGYRLEEAVGGLFELIGTCRKDVQSEAECAVSWLDRRWDFDAVVGGVA